MWDCTQWSNDLTGDWKDRPCNLAVSLGVRKKKLNMSIYCRSNDIIWGCYGANAVHFSMLLEYLAGRIGVGMGTMVQYSHNWHVYVDVLKKFEEKEGPHRPEVTKYKMDHCFIGKHWDDWDNDLNAFMEWHNLPALRRPEFVNQWFSDIAVPMVRTHALYREKDHHGAMLMADAIRAEDWRLAAKSWLIRRQS